VPYISAGKGFSNKENYCKLNYGAGNQHFLRTELGQNRKDQRIL
jgi:hypothetical protein